MRRIVLSVQSFLLADAIERALAEGADCQVFRAERPADIPRLCREVTPYALLMETSAYPPFDLERRLAVREEVRRCAPACRVVLLCDENAERLLAERVKQAKKDGLIDNFLYSSVSASYLAAVMDTL